MMGDAVETEGVLRRYCPRCGYPVAVDVPNCPNYPNGRLGRLCDTDLTGVEPRHAPISAGPPPREPVSVLRLIRRLTVGALGLAALLLILGVTFEQAARWRVSAVHPPPGIVVDVRGERLHLSCTGEGSPAVILESGAGSASVLWSSVQPQIAESARVCSYDRAGLGWSGKRVGSHDAVTIAEDLHALLQTASLEPPYLFVGHSLGGPRALVFDRLFPGEIAGFVFVDATDPDMIDRQTGDWAEAEAAIGRTTALYSLLAATGVLRIIGGIGGDDRTEMENTALALLPQSMPEFLREARGVAQTLKEAQKSESFGSRPTVVLTAGGAGDLEPPPADADDGDLRMQLQGELAALSTNSDHRVVSGAGHFIQVDAPGEVIKAVRDVLAAIREGGPVREADGG